MRPIANVGPTAECYLGVIFDNTMSFLHNILLILFMDNSLIFMRLEKFMGFPKNNFCFKIKYFKFEDGLSLFALVKTQSETDCLPSLERRNNYEKM